MMKNFRISAVFVVVALVLALGMSILAARNSSGQSPISQRKSPVKPAVRITEPSGTSSYAAFAPAAEQNTTLRTDLTWTFGGKQQRGWYLYDSLIAHTLNADSDSTTPAFAASLAAWQKKRGLNPNGVLDENSLMTMISQWQSTRIKDRTIADPTQLLTVTSTYFYDPGRAEELRGVERTTYDAYKSMIAAAIADPTLRLAHDGPTELASTEKYFKIISAFRSRDYQDELRRKSPNSGSAGLAVNSPHFTGRALDIYVGGDPVETRDDNRALQVKTPAYQWLVKNAERFGFRPYFYEPWHWEYVR
jgi:zinc D-Ala-D-Ala carboxypeptidase